MTHRVQTTHIQRLIKNGLDLAQRVNGVLDYEFIPSETQESILPQDALEKAAADLRHAAEELDAERLSCKGWPQV